MEQLYRINTNGQADKGAIVQGEKYRFTLLTEEMIRLEYSEDHSVALFPTVVGCAG